MNLLKFRYLIFSKDKPTVSDILFDFEKNKIDFEPFRKTSNCFDPIIFFFDCNSNFNEIAENVEDLKLTVSDPKFIGISTDLIPKNLSWQLLKIGLNEIFCWKTTEKPVEIIRSRLSYWAYNGLVVSELQTKLVGESTVWKKTLSQIVDMAISNSSILITGESGTGKELVARQIHELDKRHEKKDYVVVDCTNLTPNLSGSELFGHEKGSFTNAMSMREGAVELANDGTLFLDELGELPLTLQAELLRVLQEKTFKRIGSNVWRKVQFRLVTATNRNLEEEIKKGNFRQDLFYRISGWTCKLPSLNERKEDIPILAKHFFKELHNQTKIDEQVLEFLSMKEYQGNVRELQQLVNRIANKHIGEGPITIGDIPYNDLPDFDSFLKTNENVESDLGNLVKQMLSDGVSLKDLKELISEIAKQEAINNESGNIKLAARRLGCSPRILQMHKKENSMRIHKSA